VSNFFISLYGTSSGSGDAMAGAGLRRHGQFALCNLRAFFAEVQLIQNLPFLPHLSSGSTDHRNACVEFTRGRVGQLLQWFVKLFGERLMNVPRGFMLSLRTFTVPKF
jgi:hypothetical protein